ncbi:hypothetical protein FHU39_002038 [Flexivirga oryzae]|uniref:Uncharacterized protein n=1 Tax=Flexivirga oryzae TaxID=1794944 RepID=A0A839N7R5_9MICO|nr:hypothetical protein [Flexivirga oryzae]
MFRHTRRLRTPIRADGAWCCLSWGVLRAAGLRCQERALTWRWKDAARSCCWAWSESDPGTRPGLVLPLSSGPSSTRADQRPTWALALVRNRPSVVGSRLRPSDSRSDQSGRAVPHWPRLRPRPRMRSPRRPPVARPCGGREGCVPERGDAPPGIARGDALRSYSTISTSADGCGLRNRTGEGYRALTSHTAAPWRSTGRGSRRVRPRRLSRSWTNIGTVPRANTPPDT